MPTDDERSAPVWPRVAAATVIVLICVGAALLLTTMALYPGGNWADHGARGHAFFRNFFCDLLGDVADNGEPNPGARFATAGMLLVFAALLPFWLLVPRLLPGRARLGAAVRALGLASAVVLSVVPLTPSGRCGQLHAAAIFVAGAPGLVAAALAAYALMASHATRWPHGAGIGNARTFAPVTPLGGGAWGCPRSAPPPTCPSTARAFPSQGAPHPRRGSSARWRAEARLGSGGLEAQVGLLP